MTRNFSTAASSLALLALACVCGAAQAQARSKTHHAAQAPAQVVSSTPIAAAPAPASALDSDTTKNELEGSSAAALVFGSGVNTGFVAQAGYSHLLPIEMLQGTVTAGFATANSTTTVLLKMGPTYNYSIDGTGLRNAFYARGLVGVAFVHLPDLTGGGATQNSLNLAYTLEVGKRFELWNSAYWKPAFQVSGVTGSNVTNSAFNVAGNNPLFSIIPLQFSFLFDCSK